MEQACSRSGDNQVPGQHIASNPDRSSLALFIDALSPSVIVACCIIKIGASSPSPYTIKCCIPPSSSNCCMLHTYLLSCYVEWTPNGMMHCWCCWQWCWWWWLHFSLTNVLMKPTKDYAKNHHTASSCHWRRSSSVLSCFIFYCYVPLYNCSLYHRWLLHVALLYYIDDWLGAISVTICHQILPPPSSKKISCFIHEYWLLCYVEWTSDGMMIAFLVDVDDGVWYCRYCRRMLLSN